ncbi:UEV domain-containing protein [Tribonema minus]|uniref:UEV domain-containing protein n=1 Tax=Tribonema minus TaxID=303371 RepID=A0A835ZFB1_9STRA|nr:UEV domain-containing protein [Tribonema minus]
MAPAGVDALLAQFTCYRDVARIRWDISNVLTNVKTLSPAAGSLVLNTGEELHLATLAGTISISFRGASYNIPVEIFITKHYPESPPMAYVRPTKDMDIQKGHRHVDSAGMVYLPYLHEWEARSHDLVELCAAMSGVFGQDPPVYARSSSASSSAGGSFQSGGSSFPSGLSGGGNSTGPVSSAAYAGGKLGGWGGGAGGGADSPPSYAAATAAKEDPVEAARRDVTVKMTGTLQALYEDLRGKIDAEFDAQTALRENQVRLERDLQQAKEQRRHLSGLIPLAQEKKLELDSYAVERKAAAAAHAQPDAEDLVEARDPLSRQLLSLVAENAAIEDALYYLDQGITDGRLSTDEFLREVRRLTRRQFAARALANKVVAAQQQQQQQAQQRPQQQQQQHAGSYSPPPQPRWQPNQLPPIANGAPQLPPRRPSQQGQDAHWLRHPQQA